MNRVTPSAPPHPLPASPRVEAASDPRAMPDMYLSGRWLLAAHAAWVTVVVLISAFFLANLPFYATHLRTICLRPQCPPWQLTSASAQALRRMLLTPDGYALLSLALSVTCVLVWYAFAGLIVWRQSRQWLALLTSLLLLANGVTQMSGDMVAPLSYNAPVEYAIAWFVGLFSVALYVPVFSLFPSGRFVPGWMRWAMFPLGLALLWLYGYVITSPLPIELSRALSPLYIGGGAVLIFPIMGAQIYRYRRVSSPVERQQTKWVVLAVIEGPLVGVLYFLLPQIVPALRQPDSLYFLLARPAYNLLWLFCPVCFGIAMLRYHLWDIDVIIRRTLVYGTLTALLAALYFGVIVGLQALVGSVNSAAASSPVISVATTLLIAALFTPLRRGIQATIDRRFYRRKYDAARTIEAFGAALRSETDLAQLSAQLVMVVEETMQPASVSLWLRPPERPADQAN